ncbi:GNAT family N-acetyltransferase [Bacillus sp. RG28]|uniref:GNAT family N-acetyltransferase n=1 Tax=Gottfriedia endophytica TaxID=2820819 RepID=A0A940NXP3_9BACI|nr:GNAT family N-acetyltransferase [Gottfriedia endophytica]MBP0726958.1 GNAT family N-acetyltransferase [Gottfriedia endophytica]
MELFIKDMNEKFAVEIVNWRYEAPYDFYDNEETFEAINEMIENPYYAVVNQSEELVGFFCIGSSAQVPIGHQFGAYSEEILDIGIGMKPDMTGKGFGFTFFSKVLQTIGKDKSIRLTVAEFNRRAIRLYKKLGFIEKMKFKRDSIEFIVMIKE